jgi:microcompartment protein CcmK/EutM
MSLVNFEMASLYMFSELTGFLWALPLKQHYITVAGLVRGPVQFVERGNGGAPDTQVVDGTGHEIVHVLVVLDAELELLYQLGEDAYRGRHVAHRDVGRGDGEATLVRGGGACRISREHAQAVAIVGSCGACLVDERWGTHRETGGYCGGEECSDDGMHREFSGRGEANDAFLWFGSSRYTEIYRRERTFKRKLINVINSKFNAIDHENRLFNVLPAIFQFFPQ